MDAIVVKTGTNGRHYVLRGHKVVDRATSLSEAHKLADALYLELKAAETGEFNEREFDAAVQAAEAEESRRVAAAKMEWDAMLDAQATVDPHDIGGETIEGTSGDCAGGTCIDIYTKCSKHSAQYQNRWGRASNE